MKRIFRPQGRSTAHVLQLFSKQSPKYTKEENKFSELEVTDNYESKTCSQKNVVPEVKSSDDL